MINLDQREVTAEVTKLMEAGNYGGASALLRLASSNSTDTAKAETVTPLVKEGKQEGDSKQVSVTVKKAKVRRKVSRRGVHVVGSGRVTLTTHLYRVWLGCQALLNAEAELANAEVRAGGQPMDKGFTFNGCSCRFVTTFLGREFWTQKAANSVGNAMGQLKSKGLLVWETEKVPGKSNRSIRSGFGFGPKA